MCVSAYACGTVVSLADELSALMGASVKVDPLLLGGDDDEETSAATSFTIMPSLAAAQRAGTAYSGQRMHVVLVHAECC